MYYSHGQAFDFDLFLEFFVAQLSTLVVNVNIQLLKKVGFIVKLPILDTVSFLHGSTIFNYIFSQIEIHESYTLWKISLHLCK